MYTVGKMATFHIQGLLVAYKERFDKDNFIKNLLLDNLLLVDIYSRAKKLHIQAEVRRVAMIVEAENDKENNALEIIRTNMSAGNKDFITAVDENNVIVVKDLSEGDSVKDIEKAAKSIIATLEKGGFRNVRVAYGTIINEIKEVSRSYKEAKMALDVGKIFFDERNIIAYSELGIGRLIHQLPISLCEMFLNEVFKGNAQEQFDKETLMTVNAFFENNLNISETARQMYLHRNTLGYRLEKIMKTTGLDVKKFDDALTFKIALMVSDHMRYIKSQE